MQTFTVSTTDRLSVQDITDEVQEVVSENHTGIVTVYVQHTTAGITINEGESRLLDDFEKALSDLVADTGWKHDQIDDNADSHIRAMLVGASETIPVVDGSLQLGTWQSVLFVECDGPRSRTVQAIES